MNESAAMKKSVAALLVLIGTLLAVPGHGNAESRTISWVAVTSYADGTAIEPGKTVSYDIFWSADAGVTPGSIQPIATSISQSSTTFDPDFLGMPRGQTVYLTGEAVLNTGERSSLAPAYPWNVPTLINLSISGPSSVNSSGSGTYAATATWSDGTTTSVAPSWSVDPPYASIGPGGVLATMSVTSDQLLTITASFPSGGVTKTASTPVTIVDVPTVPALAWPQNVAVTGPVAISPAKLFRLCWDPIISYADGTPVGAGNVWYMAYWSSDPGLSQETLRPLGSSTNVTSVTFDPIAEGMARNQRVYFATRATAASGVQSALSLAISWVAVNQGPAAPSDGRIIKK
jgi:hypothetical protein